MSEFSFTSMLSEQYREALGQLLFFNPSQQHVHADILASIERFGIPHIIVDKGLVRIVINELYDVQNLFALINQSELVGSAVYIRDNPTNLTILHLAVAPERLMKTTAVVPLAVILFLQVVEVGRRVKGITTVTILYGPGKAMQYAVQPRKRT